MQQKPIILEYNDDTINLCVERILNNQLVAFPTETVYGLGANGLCEEACNKIYEYKRRPKSDPLILHINDIKDSKPLINITDKEYKIFKLLSDKFWPGPLTFILRKSDIINYSITNNSEYVGIRSPNNPIARELIKRSGVPIAAPSANLFCHVSPTKAVHVYNDFYDKDLAIIDGGQCEIGMESTIIKIDNNRINILRYGGINQIEILQELYKLDFEFEFDIKIKTIGNNNNIDCPGQFTKHYAPNCECYLFEDINKVFDKYKYVDGGNYLKGKCVLIDFGNNFINYKDCFMGYKDISTAGDVKEGMKNFYSSLRDSELLDNTECIIIFYIKNGAISKTNIDYLDTILDKQLRSASGKII